MEASLAPEEIGQAILRGEVEVVRSWLDNGGDANAKCQVPRYGSFLEIELLLLVAARCGRASIVDLLLSRGADIDATDPEGRTAVYETLNCWTSHRSLPTLRLLLSHGADVNLARDRADRALGGISPLMCCTYEEGPNVIRLLLRAGADPKHRTRHGRTAEEGYRQAFFSNNHVVSCADLLRDVRLAGGWVRYALQPHYGLLVLRALCHRGRASFSARTPEVLVRLFGAPDGRRRTRSTRATEGVRAHLPDPLFWRVLEFSLGTAYDYPWVRERVRARAALSRGGRGSH